MAQTEPSADVKSHSGWFITFVVMAPLLYVLSIGPVAAVVSRTQNSRAIHLLQKVYAPVIWVHEHTILKKPLEAYVELWGVK